MPKTRAERLISNAEGMDAVVIANDGEPFLDSTFWYLTEQNSGTFEREPGTFASTTTVPSARRSSGTR